MRPAARRATKTAHGRPPLSFAPARRRLAPLWPVEAPMWSMPEAIELAWEHAYPGREAAERNECMRAV